MKIKYEEGTCQNCGSDVEIAIDENANKIYTHNNLASFNFYKNIGLSKCPICGYIAQDITKDSAKNFNKIATTEKYKFLQNYKYLTNIEDVDANILDRYNACDYECYAYYLATQKKFEESIRYMYRSIELKNAIIKMMNISKFADYDDDEQVERNAIDKFVLDIKQSIDKNQKAIVEMNSEKYNVYTKVMYTITLSNLNYDDKTNSEFEKLKSLNISQDLLDYTKSKIEENL